jgi:four helix bundle protein
VSAGKTSPADRAHCYVIARGEAMECGAILDVVRLLRVVPDADVDECKLLVVRMVEMLTKMCR